MNMPRNILLGISVLTIALIIVYLERIKAPARNSPTAERVIIQPKFEVVPGSETETDAAVAQEGVSSAPLKKMPNISVATKELRYPRAIEIAGPTGFLNTPPLKLADIVGRKVILVDFWTYSCINCQRTLPYLNAWYEKYKDKGLEIVGIHTPEFEFEKDPKNVEAAIQKYGVRYPVVQDNNYSTWTAYGNRYWPRKYLIDIDGFIVYDHIGEGAYDETEEKIRELLEERMERLGMGKGLSEEKASPQNVTQVDFSKVGSPETYFGSRRNENFGSGSSGTTGRQTFTSPPSSAQNTLYLSGDWDIQPEYAEAKASGDRIVFRFNAKNVYLVASAPTETTLRINIDGKEVRTLSVRAEDLYRIVELPDYGEHTLEIIVDGVGVRAFAFTFG